MPAASSGACPRALRKAAASTGLITSATNSDEASTTITVIGRYFMNSPMIPGQNSSGRNTATVVPVEAMIGQATSRVAVSAARARGSPSETWR